MRARHTAAAGIGGDPDPTHVEGQQPAGRPPLAARDGTLHREQLGPRGFGRPTQPAAAGRFAQALAAAGWSRKAFRISSARRQEFADAASSQALALDGAV